MKNEIGQSVGPYREEVTRERILKFAEAVGIVSDGREAPPTFITRCRKGEFDLMQKLGIKLSQVLHGEQEYHYTGAIMAGDELTYTTSLSNTFEKKGGGALLKFLVLDTQISTANGQVAVSKTTIIMREAL